MDISQKLFDKWLYFRYLILAGLPWYFSNKGTSSSERIRGYKNKHLGKRCFIIGNGPSLKKMDLSKLSNELTFGLNRIYLMFPKLGFPTSYLVCVNKLVIEQCAHDLNNLDIPKFFSWESREHIDFDNNVSFLRSRYGTLDFSKVPDQYIYEGATVTYVAMQLAYYMGFSEVYLIGVDHHFATKGPAHKEVISHGDDPNHFAGNYFGKGFRWQLPDLEQSERAYELARSAFVSDKRVIKDATVNGKLNIFEKTNFEDLF